MTESALGHPHLTPAARIDAMPAGKVGIWLFLAAEMMFFIGLLGSYIVLRSASQALFDQQAQLLSKLLGAVNTLVLLGSSLTMGLAVAAARAGRRERVLAMLGLTILIAGVFLFISGVEPRRAMHENLFWASFVTLTGALAAHLIGGMLAAALLWAQALRGKLFPAAMEYVAMYWHFVVGVWIVLFGLLYLV